MTDAADADRRRFLALRGVLARTVTDPRAEEEIARDARAWLAAAGAEGDDLEVLAAYEPRRLLVYRKLVHRGLTAALEAQMPRALRRLGARLAGDVAAFFAERGPSSHYLRDVPRELVEHAAPRWAADPALPPFLADLARHELSLFEVAAAPRATPSAVDPEALDLARPVVLAAEARLLRYGFPVHLLRDDDDHLAPAPTELLAYRDAEHDVRYLALSPFGAGLCGALIAGEALGAAVRAAASALDLSLEQGAARAAQLLADLAERGVVLGARR